MKVSQFTRDVLANRRQQRDMLRDKWELVGDNGGKLWELDRGYRTNCIIKDVKIAVNGKQLWVKIGPA